MVAWKAEHECSGSGDELHLVLIARRPKDAPWQQHMLRVCCTAAEFRAVYYPTVWFPTGGMVTVTNEVWRYGQDWLQSENSGNP